MIDSSYPDDPKCVVYMAINLVNNKFYIGATEKGVRERQMRHLWNARNGRPGKFYNAIRKYGEDNFLFVNYLKCNDFWEALKEESFYIKALKPHYNMTLGGGGVKGYKFSKESRARMSAARKGKKGRSLSEATRLRIAAAHRGRKITDETRLAQCRAAVKAAAQKRRIRVRCLSDGKEFASIQEAADFYGKTHRTISEYCRGRKSRNGLLFVKVEGGHPHV